MIELLLGVIILMMFNAHEAEKRAKIREELKRKGWK